jgi:acetyl esterase/lipase
VPNRPASPFHPDLRRIARILPRRPVRPRSLAVVRRAQRLLELRTPPDVSVEAVGEVTVRLHRPPDATGPLPALLWIHGGGLVVGNAAQDDSLARYFAREAGCIVAVVDYRLAPEHRFPAALDDCHAALVWLAQRDDVDGARVAIGGASAGGGLAAALALAARERGEVSPAFQLLVYPMLDDRTATRTDLDETNFRMWVNESNAFGWRCYLGAEPGSDGVSPLAAPARHEDLAGLPPAWIGVGTLDLFHDEDVAYAARLSDAGVPCRLEVVEGAFHGFDLHRLAPVTKRFHAAQAQALLDAFAVSPEG